VSSVVGWLPWRTDPCRIASFVYPPWPHVFASVRSFRHRYVFAVAIADADGDTDAVTGTDPKPDAVGQPSAHSQSVPGAHPDTVAQCISDAVPDAVCHALTVRQ
jgi:hypothetical protein